MHTYPLLPPAHMETPKSNAVKEVDQVFLAFVVVALVMAAVAFFF